MTRAIRLSMLVVATGALCASQATAQMAKPVPPAVAAPGAKIVAKFQGVGAQIYECTRNKDGKLAWVFREPIAALIFNGKTVGRHYAGPTWEYTDGSKIVGKVTGHAPGATADDVAWLKLHVIKHRGHGMFSKVNTVQRLDTDGGGLAGSCEAAGAFKSVAYSATYVFLHAGR
jgi:hypothetical protein